MDNRNTILKLLCDGEFHSGETLANLLGITRAAVSNHIKALEKLGIEVFSVKGKGYKLPNPMALLDEAKIKEYVGDYVNVFNVIDSTNQYIKDRISQKANGEICLAEAQTAGRGRRGKQWHSPFGSNLYLSMLWKFDHGYQALDGLSLVIGVVITDTIETLYNVPIQLKWPNDIWYDQRKLGGVLVEVDGQFGGSCNTIIGIGLNINMSDKADVDQPWINLSEIVMKEIDRNQFASLLIINLRESLALFEEKGFSPYADRWRAKNALLNKNVTINAGKDSFSGICTDVDHRGGLVIKEKNQEALRSFYGGEVSVRPL